MWISYLGIFICILSAYDVYEEKNAVLFTSPIILLILYIFFIQVKYISIILTFDWILFSRAYLVLHLHLQKSECYFQCVNWATARGCETHSISLNHAISFHFQKHLPDAYCKKKNAFLIFFNFHRKTPLLHRKTHFSESLLNSVPFLQASKLNKKRLQHRSFPVKFAKILRTFILQNICERLLYISDDLYKHVSHN